MVNAVAGTRPGGNDSRELSKITTLFGASFADAFCTASVSKATRISIASPTVLRETTEARMKAAACPPLMREAILLVR